MPKSMNIGMMMAVAAWPAAMALVAVVCGCGRESEQAEKPAPDVQVAQPPVVQPPAAQPPVEQQPSVQGQGGTTINPATALDSDAIAITNISAMTDMEYVSLDGGKAPRRMLEPREPSGEAAKWFECADDPTWFTNSVGERISVERYCAIVNVEAGQAAECSFDGRYQRCGADMTLRLAEYYVGEECRVGDSGNGEVVDGSDNRVVYHAWKVRDDLYLLFVEDNSGTMKMRDYIMVMFDGVVFARLVQFDYSPSEEQMKNVLRARTNAAALNNVAVMIDRDEAERRMADENYIVKLLEMAALGGEPVACRNLAYYYKRKENTARSATWSKLAGTVARRRGRNAVGKLPLRPLIEWPLMFDAPVTGHEKDAEDFLTALLKSSGLDCDGGAKWGYAEQRWFKVKGYESILVIEDEVKDVRAVRYAVWNIPEKRSRLAEDFVEKLNKSATNVVFRCDGSAAWCECSLSIESIRRMKSQTKQRNALISILALTDKSMQPHTSTLVSFEKEEFGQKIEAHQTP